MSQETDILNIDAKIMAQFCEQQERLPEYMRRLEELEEYLNTALVSRTQKVVKKNYDELKKRVKDIESGEKMNFYIAETSDIITEYRQMLKTPQKISFMGKPIKNDKEKNALISEYLEIVQKYTPINIVTPPKKQKIVCGNCPNRKDFEIIDGNVYICSECSAQQVVMKQMSSYKDIERINISSKYTYDRKIHFRDCINQYQGKQNSTIAPKVYKELEDQLERHHLLCGDSEDPKEVRFANITKEHIMMFLKDLEYTKHYENVNLIHYNMTGKKPDDIGYLEDQLLDDFDQLTELYDKTFKHIDRKNFINTQFVLYQLLLLHKHPCKMEDFSILKTTDRKCFHDEILSELFGQIGWSYVPSI